MAKRGKRSKKKGKKGAKRHTGGHIPLDVLERRLEKLNRKVRARGGDVYPEG